MIMKTSDDVDNDDTEGIVSRSPRDASPREEHEPLECEICLAPFTDDHDYGLLACGHSFCFDCTSSYVKMGPISSRLTFHHIHCPFRCGSCFVESASIMRSPDLRTLVQNQVDLMERVKKLARETFVREQAATPDVEFESEKDLEVYVLDKYSIFECGNCKNIFVGTAAVCGAAGEESTDNANSLCGSCKSSTKTNESKSDSRGTHSQLAVLLNGSIERNVTQKADQEMPICDSDSNAMAQSCEVEAMMSIFAEEMEIIVPPPTTAGELCAVYAIRLHNNKAPEAAHDIQNRYVYRGMKVCGVSSLIVVSNFASCPLVVGYFR